MKITATIITLNEELHIVRAIESLRCCDEILVLDSGSADRTMELAEKLGARVLESPWRGYAGQKNWAAEQATHDWILSLDADEALSEALEGEIWNLKKNGPKFDAYTMPRLRPYLGRWILHSGWYPDRKVRLYNRQQGKWMGDFVHESVQVHGRVGHLESNLLHFTCDSLSEHLRTMDRRCSESESQVKCSRFDSKCPKRPRTCTLSCTKSPTHLAFWRLYSRTLRSGYQPLCRIQRPRYCAMRGMV